MHAPHPPTRDPPRTRRTFEEGGDPGRHHRLRAIEVRCHHHRLADTDDGIRASSTGVNSAARTPLWQAGGNVSDLGPLRLDPELVQDLLEWQRYFDHHFGVDRWPHWDTADAASWYQSQGRVLHARMTQALPARTVTLDLWPVEEAAPGE